MAMRNFRKLIYPFLIVAFLTVGLTYITAQEQWNPQVKVIEPIGTNGWVNYGEGLIRATGIGAAPPDAVNLAQARAMALRAAKADAYRQLLETVKGVRVNSETVVENFITKSDEIRLQVQGIVKGAGVVDTKYLSDGSVEVTLEMSLTGDLSHLMLPSEPKQPPPVIPTTATTTTTTTTTTAPPPTTPDTTTSPVPTPVPEVTGVGTATGLIIDATGLGISPCMAPKIVTPDGYEVYGSAYVDRNFAVKQGMVGYVRTLDQAKSNTRVSEPPPPNPMVIKAEAAVGKMKTDIQISKDDAVKLQSVKDHLSILQNCRVIFVVG
ncbi:LPP20 family lipoprotein [candidate division CSSED10-310 bacterium]|uniref:LPP20 family lipoprotein n=1 Tax=candidate division CSSED10-310 bacterium TaxID=2855610 RepID=A0ABV6Z4S5_UNCC1